MFSSFFIPQCIDVVLDQSVFPWTSSMGGDSLSKETMSSPIQCTEADICIVPSVVGVCSTQVSIRTCMYIIMT